MNIITVDEEVWKHLNERLKAISEYILKLEDTSYDSLWLNNHEVCQYLHISEKTLWRMRTNGQTVEIRITIQRIGNYSNTQYFLRYFQFDGQGTLQYYDEPPYLPNDLYQLPTEQFRLYYTSTSAISQSFDVWISDSFGNEKQITFQFNSSD